MQYFYWTEFTNPFNTKWFTTIEPFLSRFIGNEIFYKEAQSDKINIAPEKNWSTCIQKPRIYQCRKF